MNTTIPYPALTRDSEMKNKALADKYAGAPYRTEPEYKSQKGR